MSKIRVMQCFSKLVPVSYMNKSHIFRLPKCMSCLSITKMLSNGNDKTRLIFHIWIIIYSIISAIESLKKVDESNDVPSPEIPSCSSSSSTSVSIESSKYLRAFETVWKTFVSSMKSLYTVQHPSSIFTDVKVCLLYLEKFYICISYLS